MKEIWKDIKGYDGIYQISDRGRVKSVYRVTKYVTGRTRTEKERVLKQEVNLHGYCTLRLCKNSEYKRFFIHRLIANAFIPNPKNKSSINHINSIRDDNEIDNLEWVTHSENCIHGHKYGNMKNSSKVHCGNVGKSVFQISRDGAVIRKYNTMTDASVSTGTLRTNIGLACRGKLKTAGGYKWAYA